LRIRPFTDALTQRFSWSAALQRRDAALVIVERARLDPLATLDTIQRRRMRRKSIPNAVHLIAQLVKCDAVLVEAGVNAFEGRHDVAEGGLVHGALSFTTRTRFG
jgi:hypothetical protein